jgi:hypothetical protein
MVKSWRYRMVLTLLLLLCVNGLVLCVTCVNAVLLFCYLQSQIDSMGEVYMVPMCLPHQGRSLTMKKKDVDRVSALTCLSIWQSLERSTLAHFIVIGYESGIVRILSEKGHFLAYFHIQQTACTRLRASVVLGDIRSIECLLVLHAQNVVVEIEGFALSEELLRLYHACDNTPTNNLDVLEEAGNLASSLRSSGAVKRYHLSSVETVTDIAGLSLERRVSVENTDIVHAQLICSTGAPYFATWEMTAPSNKSAVDIATQMASKVTSSMFSFAKGLWRGEDNSGSASHPGRSASNDAASLSVGLKELRPSLNWDDGHRRGLSCSVDVSGRFVAVMDQLGRCMVINAHTGGVLRLLKGYRHGQLAWSSHTLPSSDSANSSNTNTSTNTNTNTSTNNHSTISLLWCWQGSKSQRAQLSCWRAPSGTLLWQSNALVEDGHTADMPHTLLPASLPLRTSMRQVSPAEQALFQPLVLCTNGDLYRVALPESISTSKIQGHVHAWEERFGRHGQASPMAGEMTEIMQQLQQLQKYVQQGAAATQISQQWAQVLHTCGSLRQVASLNQIANVLASQDHAYLSTSQQAEAAAVLSDALLECDDEINEEHQPSQDGELLQRLKHQLQIRARLLRIYDLLTACYLEVQPAGRRVLSNLDTTDDLTGQATEEAAAEKEGKDDDDQGEDANDNLTHSQSKVKDQESASSPATVPDLIAACLSGKCASIRQVTESLQAGELPASYRDKEKAAGNTLPLKWMEFSQALTWELVQDTPIVVLGHVSPDMRLRVACFVVGLGLDLPLDEGHPWELLHLSAETQAHLLAAMIGKVLDESVREE